MFQTYRKGSIRSSGQLEAPAPRASARGLEPRALAANTPLLREQGLRPSALHSEFSPLGLRLPISGLPASSHLRPRPLSGPTASLSLLALSWPLARGGTPLGEELAFWVPSRKQPWGEKKAPLSLPKPPAQSRGRQMGADKWNESGTSTITF